MLKHNLRRTPQPTDEVYLVGKAPVGEFLWTGVCVFGRLPPLRMHPLSPRDHRMLTALAKMFKPFPLGPWSRIAVLLGCMALPGCAQPDVRGDKFAEDDLSKISRQLRPRDPDIEPAGLSSRARQIEADLGAR
jgi:hypothetical protein